MRSPFPTRGFLSAPRSPPPPPPGPTPIPIQILPGPAPPPGSASSSRSGSPAPGDRASATPTRSDDFYPAWTNFLALQPRRAAATSRAAAAVGKVKRTVEAQEQKREDAGVAVEADVEGVSPAEGLATQAPNADSSYARAAEQCRRKVAAIVKECRRLNQKYTDALFDLDRDVDCLLSLTGAVPDCIQGIENFPPWVKRVEDIFDDPKFFVDGASANDVHQGKDGDCWFLAALMAACAKKELIEKLCVARDEKVGVYGFVFFRDGEWIYEVIDDKLYLKVGDEDDLAIVRDVNIRRSEGRPVRLGYDDDKLKLLLQKGGEALYFSHCKSNETWLPLIEKAYAKAHGDYGAIEGGWASEGIEDITGGVGVNLNPEDIMDKDRFWAEQLMQVNKKYLIGAGTRAKDVKGLFSGHAYAVLDAFEEGELRLLKIRNPWGEQEWSGDWSDGSKLWTAEWMVKLKHTFGDDGVFWMPYADFLRHFRAISRVRLFDDSWSIASRWTCVSPPWTLDYLDTRFEFTLTKTSPVVLTLSQPDRRYFRDLTGRYRYALHFRVYKQEDGNGGGDEEDEPTADVDGLDPRWIVRSMHSSGTDPTSTRSVSAEIEDLEPGTYSVVFKVTASRYADFPTYAETIQKFAVRSKEKLLAMGRRFDYAQSKGNLQAAEKAAGQQRIRDEIALRRAAMKRGRKVTQAIKARERKRAERGKQEAKKRTRAFLFEKWKREKKELKKEKARQAKAEARERVRAAREEAEMVAKETAAGKEKAEEQKEAVEGEPVEKKEVTDAPEAEKPDAPLVSPLEPKDAEAGAAASSTEQTSAPISPLPVTGPAEDTKAVAATGSGTQEPPSDALAKLFLDKAEPETAPADAQPEIDEEESESEFEWDSPLEEPDDIDDDDFDWDSDIDGPTFETTPLDTDLLPSDDEDATGPNVAHAKDELFGDDPWNARVVLGLRVYSHDASLAVKVVKEQE